MNKVQILLGGLVVAAASTCLSLLVTNQIIARDLGAIRQNAQVLYVNTDVALKVFVEERTEGWEAEQIADSMKLLVDLMRDEIDALHAQTGFPILDSRQVLAGGNDVSEQFAQRVLKRWDERDES